MHIKVHLPVLGLLQGFSLALLRFNLTLPKRLQAEAGRTQLSSPNPGIKEIHKSVRRTALLAPCFLENRVSFFF